MGDYYLTGFFDGSLNFYNSTGVDLSLNNVGINDIFIAKYNTSGTLLWARRIAGTHVDQPVSIVTDNTNVYVTGYFYSSTLNFYNSTGIDLSFNIIGNNDTYIAKYNTSGSLLWARQIAGTGLDQPVSIVTDNTNVYITGFFDGSLNFYNSTGIDLSFNNIGNNDTYIAKYNTSGSLLWARQIAGTGIDKPVSIVTDNTNVYLTGYFSNSLNFYNSTGVDLSFNNAGSNDTYIAKYDTSGTILWARRIAGTGIDQPVSIVIDNTNVYLTGYFSNSLNFYNSTGVDLSFNNIGNNDTYIAKYNTSGSLLWARQIAGSGLDQPVSIVTDNTNVYLTGYFRNLLNFYNSTGIVLSLDNAAGSNDTYIAKYDPSGTLLWARRIAGVKSDQPVSIVTDNTNVYLTGYFSSSTLNFYNSTGIDLSFNVVGLNDTYIAKYDPAGTILWARQIIGPGEERSVSSCVTLLPPEPISNICFIQGTLVETDQGEIPIEMINNTNTINNLKVMEVTRTISFDKYLICIEKDSLELNYPNRRTIISQAHKLFFKGQLIQSKDLNNVVKIPYNGEILYNVLLEENGFMKINNLICETLDINNVIAYLYRSPNKIEITKLLNKTKTFEEYQQIALTHL
jgi:hypothetical protein